MLSLRLSTSWSSVKSSSSMSEFQWRAHKALQWPRCNPDGLVVEVDSRNSCSVIVGCIGSECILSVCRKCWIKVATDIGSEETSYLRCRISVPRDVSPPFSRSRHNGGTVKGVPYACTKCSWFCC